MMATRNPNKVILFVLLFFSLSACVSPKSTHSSRVIVYNVFDSLENLLCKRIEAMHSDSIYMMIAPAGDFRTGPIYTIDSCGERKEYKPLYFIYTISIYNSHQDPTDSIFKISNRKMSICGKLYPVYVLRYDDVFRESIEKKNKPFGNNPRNEPIDLYARGEYIVDMSKKIVLQSTFSD